MTDKSSRQNLENKIENNRVARTLKKSLINLLFAALVTAVACAEIYPSMYRLNKYMKEKFIEQTFLVKDVGIQLSFSQITDVFQFWAYCDAVLLKHWEGIGDSNSSANTNRVDVMSNYFSVTVEIRQVKVKRRPCKIENSLLNVVKSCYGEFSKANEDKLTFGTSEEDSAWMYRSQAITKSSIYRGKISQYDGGGFVTHLGPSLFKAKNTLTQLKNNLWIDRGTRCVFIDVIFYNVNLNLLCFIKLIFEFPATGGTIPSFLIQTLKSETPLKVKDYVILLYKILIAIFLIIRNVSLFKKMIAVQKCANPRNFVMQVTILVIGYVYLATSVYKYLATKDVIKACLTNDRRFLNFDQVASVALISKNLSCLLLFSVYLNMFEYININNTMGQINSTLNKCVSDILIFSVTFFVVFIAYAQLGCLLFGSQVENYHKLGYSMFTLLRTLLGEFNYEEIKRANFYLAPFFFVSYIFLAFFILMNMFLAIINDTYSDILRVILNKPKEEHFKKTCRKIITQFNLCGNMTSRLSNQSVHVQKKIIDVLQESGFNDVEIQSFLARYSINPTANINNIQSYNLINWKERCQKLGVSTNYDKSNDETNIVLKQKERIARIENLLNLSRYKLERSLIGITTTTQDKQQNRVL